MKVSTKQLVLSCEHGGNRIPAAYRTLFVDARKILQTHRGRDIGALAVARRLAKTFSAPLVYSEVSRLLVDLNRSQHHRNLFSEYTKDRVDLQEAILDKHYYPYRQKLEMTVRDTIKHHRRAAHLSVHSFTPELNGQVRNADIGLLYDPDSKYESRICLDLQRLLQASGLRVRRNYPYRGNADGLTTYLRTVFPANAYAGIELEINQNLLGAEARKTIILITRILSEYFSRS